ncbi:hypothetical protein jhhlp_002114 [Lomentospora prolificans]|uniref:ADP-ribosylhydrolase ARH3 n=1 Tax=Lomentospora prolificans TaxID=41688 RepID=A0A2N3ND69_9PEZI|nr:hypothetical protein jhhlp_002114 [Lomentospora prolificans]
MQSTQTITVPRTTLPDGDMPLSRLDRIRGALVGLHAGDALGATCEFATWERMRAKYPKGLQEIVGGGPFGFPPGHATDDTDLTRAVLLAYLDLARIRAAGGEDPDMAKLAGGYMVDWLLGNNWPERRPGTSPPDVGGATLVGLQNFQESGWDPKGCGAGPGQAGNGSLMRCLPTGLFEHDIDKIIRDSMGISAVTHDDERCTISCVAYNIIAKALVEGKTPDDALQAGLEMARKLEGQRPCGVADAIELGRKLSIEEMAERGPRELPGKGAGYVLESLSIAVAALLDQRSFDEIIVDVVRIGYDTDTNAAIAGGLVGARDGVDAVPDRWRRRLQFGSDFYETAALIDSAMASVAR